MNRPLITLISLFQKNRRKLSYQVIGKGEKSQLGAAFKLCKGKKYQSITKRGYK